MKRRIALWVTIILCGVCLGGCTDGQKAADPALVLGFSQLGSESSFRIGNTKDIEEKAKAYGVSLMMDNANQKQENQINAIRRFIAYQVDVIAFSPIVEEGWDNVLSEARQAGIPVILVDRTVETEDESLYLSQIGADFYREGVMAAEYLLKKADDMGKDHLRVVEITGTENSTPMKQRHDGFMDTIASDGRMEILESVSGDFLRSRGAECMRYLLEKYGSDIDVIFSHNDEMTMGALPQIEAAGFAPGRDMIIISIDGGQEAIDILKEGKINCIVECTPMLGSILMETALAVKAGKTVDKVIHPVERAFSDYDDLSALPPRGY
ncbi:MAG: ABC transporter substrate-binding protein [Clostridia bacterium]|nr:ABC transporter substrate-binding protein [Clostridia bacterium]